MISNKIYDNYVKYLLKGKRPECGQIVQSLLDQNINIKNLYTDLFQKSLYQVGELWEFNQISVAKEHLATAITEGLLNMIYPRLFRDHLHQKRKKIVISCTANEFHQVGGKMVADICEINGWDSYFLGANTPIDQMLTFIQETKPDLIGLSLSIYFNLDSLKQTISEVRTSFDNIDIIFGGQAFRWGGADKIRQFSRVEHIASLDQLENCLR